VFTILSACASTETKIERHYKKGSSYLSQGKYPEAVIEFRNVIQLNPNHIEGKYQLGVAYFKLGGLANFQRAYQTLTEVVEKKPELIDAQAKLGALYLISNDLKRAAEKSDSVLRKDPNNVEALLIQAKIHQLEGRLDEAEKVYRRTLEFDPKRLSTYNDLAGLYLQKKDPASAEEVLRKGLSQEPQSVDAHLSLARFYQMTLQSKEAETFYQKALTLSPQNKSIYFMLAGFYLHEKRGPEAESKLIDATKLNPKDPDPFLVLGDFYREEGKAAAAEESYLRAKEAQPEALPSRRKLAEFYLTQDKKKEAAGLVEEILTKSSGDPEGLFLKGRIFILEKKVGDAIDLFRKVIRSEPSFPGIHYYLGLALLMDHDPQQAKSEFSEAVKRNPRDIRSRLILAEIHMRSRSFDLAITEAERVAQEDPSNIKAQVILGDIALFKSDPKKGEGVYQKVIGLAPKEPIGYLRMGALRRLQRKDSEALPLFEKALSLNADSVEALSQIVLIDLANGDSEKALKRVLAQIEASPQNPVLHNLLAKLYVQRKELKKAEESFNKSIELEPNYVASYIDLGSLYVRDKQFDQAIQKLDEALKVRPNGVQIYMLRGVIYDQARKYDQAQIEYEKALKIDPSFAPAANNLAWIYAEHGGNIDQALTLAQTAKERYPDDPTISDTLGWIYYKKSAYIKAVSLLRESAEKLSQNPEVRYHLGMAYAKNGEKVLAKQELAEALKMGKGFPGSEEARKTLKAL
jgi:tetratricopeptide (TPR) repeat protein